MSLDIYVPRNLDFQTYLAIIQALRVFTDACDRKDPSLFTFAFGPIVTIDYSAVFPGGGCKDFTPEEYAALKLGPDHLGPAAISSHHLLGQPYFTSVTDDKITVEIQVLAAHGRLETGRTDTVGTISDLHWTLHVKFEKLGCQWKIRMYKIVPLYQVGDWAAIHRE